MTTDRTKYFRRDRGIDKRKRALGGERKRFQVDKMWSVHHEIARRKTLGQKNTVIARALGVDPVMVSYTVNSPNVQDKMDVLNGAKDAATIEIKEELKRMLPQAIRVFDDIINKGVAVDKQASAALIAKVAGDLIDREVGKPTQKVEGQFAHALLTLEDIEDIKNRAIKSGAVIDVTSAAA